MFQEALGFRLGAVTFDYSIIERSHAQAERWLNANAQVEVIQIQSFHSTVLAVTVVWYREGEPHA